MKPTNFITRSNYEAYMVDLWDDALSPDQKEMLLLFLDENPILKEHVFEVEQYTLPEETLFFENKNNLLKNVVAPNTLDSFLIAELENDLLPHEQQELLQFLTHNPQYKKERALYALTKVRPNKNLVFPDKRSLKKRLVSPLWIRYRYVAAAACLFLGVGVWWFSQPKLGDEMANYSKVENQWVIKNQERNTIEVQPKYKVKKPTRKLVDALHNNKEEGSLHRIAEENRTEMLPTEESRPENFYSFSKSRNPDDYLDGLVNSYIPIQVIRIPVMSEEEESTIIAAKPEKTPATLVNDFATKNLSKMIKDTALAREIKNQKYSAKTRVAKTVAWAAGKAFKGKVKAEAIPNNDGSLAAMSFSNGKYNYIKRF